MKDKAKESTISPDILFTKLGIPRGITLVMHTLKTLRRADTSLRSKQKTLALTPDTLSTIIPTRTWSWKNWVNQKWDKNFLQVSYGFNHGESSKSILEQGQSLWRNCFWEYLWKSWIWIYRHSLQKSEFKCYFTWNRPKVNKLYNFRKLQEQGYRLKNHFKNVKEPFSIEVGPG